MSDEAVCRTAPATPDLLTNKWHLPPVTYVALFLIVIGQSKGQASFGLVQPVLI